MNNEIDWKTVRRVLIVRLRSIGDTVLATPSLIALKRFLPEAQIDILLEDWVAPVLEGFREVDNVLTVGKDKKSRLKIARELRRRKYDVAFNIHGGTTATFFTFASRARHRVGYSLYRYSFLYNHLLSSAEDFWKKEEIHAAEYQLALLGFTGVPVDDRPKSRLVVTQAAQKSLEKKLDSNNSAIRNPQSAFALFHPTAAFESKQWATENFARVAEFLNEKGLQTIAVATKNERGILENLSETSRVPVTIFDDLTLPEITALAEQAELFVGNDSGIAHIAAAVNTPTVVIFGSSIVHHWRPWTDAPNEVVFDVDEPRSIKKVTVENVIKAIEKVIYF